MFAASISWELPTAPLHLGSCNRKLLLREKPFDRKFLLSLRCTVLPLGMRCEWLVLCEGQFFCDFFWEVTFDWFVQCESANGWQGNQKYYNDCSSLMRQHLLVECGVRGLTSLFFLWLFRWCSFWSLEDFTPKLMVQWKRKPILEVAKASLLWFPFEIGVFSFFWLDSRILEPLRDLLNILKLWKNWR